MFSSYTAFINSRHSNNLAVNLLQNGSARCWSGKPTPDLVPETIDTEFGPIIKICPGDSVLYAVTMSGRLIVWTPAAVQGPKQFKTTTPAIDLVQNGYIAGSRVKTVAGIGYVVIAFECTAVMFQRQEFGPSTITCKTFEHEIEEVKGSSSHCFVRTICGLHTFGSNRYQECGWHTYGPKVDGWVDVIFDQVSNIRKVVCGQYSTFIILNDGNVRACGRHYSTEDETITRIMFPQAEIVLDMATSPCLTFYITETGLCYYVQSQAAKTIKSPVLIQFLTGYFIEKIYIFYTVVIFQYDGERLLMVHLVPDREYIAVMDPAYGSGKLKPVRLDSLDNKGVCNIAQIGDYLYLTTDEGQIYYCGCNKDADGQQAERITFFDTNPAVVNRDYCRVRSAGSDTRAL